MAAVSGSQDLTMNFATMKVAGFDAEQKISPLVTIGTVTVVSFSGSFDRNRLGITYPEKRNKAILGDFTEEIVIS